MKKIFSFLLSLALLATLALPIFASDEILTTGSSGALIVDDGDLLSDYELESLLELAREITQRQACDVAVVTVDDLGGESAQDFADDYYDYNGYGYGSDRSGIMLVISMAERDWYVTTRGEAIDIFSEYRIDLIMNSILGDLSGGYYYDAFRGFLQEANSMLNVYRGTATEEELEQYSEAFEATDYYEADPDSNHSYPPRNKTANLPGSILISLLLGFVFAFIPMAVLRGQVKNVHKNNAAANYARQNSLHMDVSRDIYLYTNTTSRVIETQRTSSGGGGGGGHTHVSSSGASHGGHGGKF